ncbi:hypothetical protein L596_025161 [Steinernema carpocapsae]|uniref:Hexosyltransferase n=1 Tax=Steinernema carpocapsae TaxID=34508 RepID=A0A4U5M6Z7_STECR|nr:hypothetical protein L596_025161 [Steinernema carpocapsae]
MVYAYHFYGSSKYYLMLEDDVITVEGYIHKILSFVNNMGRPWKVCHFMKFGSIGKLYKTIDLPVIYNCVEAPCREACGLAARGVLQEGDVESVR